jgi:hypothetical protein
MSFQAWDVYGMSSLKKISQIIRPEPSYLTRSRPMIIRVVHGALAWWNVKNMVVRNVSGPSFDQSIGLLEITCDCQQWVKPIPVIAQPKTPGVDTVNDAVKGFKPGHRDELKHMNPGPKDKGNGPLSNEDDVGDPGWMIPPKGAAKK